MASNCSIRQLSSFLIVASWLRRTDGKQYLCSAGGAPAFSQPENIPEYLESLAAVINNDGSFNAKSPRAERLAICLHENSDNAAFELFQAIVADEDKILFIKTQPSRYISEPVADKSGTLGYEGVYRFGCLALDKKEQELAIKLFCEIVEKTPTKCFPIRLQDIRVMSLGYLQKLGVNDFEARCSVSDELRKAKAHQY